jgi:ABC-type glycerol-3-phosphate transport system substrate-binding protein
LYGNDNFDTWVWDDYVEFMKAVTKKKSDGTYEQYGYSGAVSDAGSMAYMMASYGADMVDDPWSYEETEALLNTEEAIASAHNYVDMTTVHEVAPTLEAQQGIEGGLFRAGMGASVISWTNQTYLVAELPFELGFMHMPFTKQRVHGLGANHWTTYKEGKHIAETQQAAIVQTTDYEVGQALVDLAATISAYDPAYYLDTLPEGDLGVVARIMLARLEGMSDCDICTKDVNKFNRSGYGRAGRFLQDTLRAELEKALTGDKSVEEAMDDADAAIDAEIAKTPIGE